MPDADDNGWKESPDTQDTLNTRPVEEIKPVDEEGRFEGSKNHKSKGQDIEDGNNAGEVKYRIGQVVKEMEKTYEMGLNPELYANAVAEKYGINLKGSGQNITIQYDPSLAVSLYGKSSESNPTVIVIGKAALLNEATLANTIAHELSHCRDFIRGAGMQHPELHKPHGNADSVNISGEQRTVYGAGNALEAYIKGERRYICIMDTGRMFQTNIVQLGERFFPKTWKELIYLNAVQFVIKGVCTDIIKWKR